MNIKRSSIKRKPYLKSGELILGGKKPLRFKNKLILGSGVKQRGDLLLVFNEILSNLNLIAASGKRKTKRGRKKTQCHSWKTKRYCYGTKSCAESSHFT